MPPLASSGGGHGPFPPLNPPLAHRRTSLRHTQTDRRCGNLANCYTLVTYLLTCYTDGRTSLRHTHTYIQTDLTETYIPLEFCISMFINLYIARPTYRFILIYTCGLTAVTKRICYVMLYTHTDGRTDLTGTVPYHTVIILYQ